MSSNGTGVDDEIAEAEVVEPDPVRTSTAVVPHQRPHGSTELIRAESAHERVRAATEIATALDAVIRGQGMRTKVGRTKVVKADGSESWEDKWHVNVEGWQTLALLLGLAVIPHDPEPIRDDDGRVQAVDYTVEKFFYPRGTKAADIKSGSVQPERVERAQVTGSLGYRCRVEVFKDGVLVGAGNGRVDRTEEAWRDRPDYALEGMAATRAQSRAIAATARWIVTLAGYATTPAEEMPHAPEQAPVEPAEAEASPDLKQMVRSVLGFLLDGDERAVSKAIDALNAQFDQRLPRSAGQAVCLVAKAVKDKRSPDAGAPA